VAEVKQSENSAFTERALDETDNRITSRIAASTLRGTVGALLAMEMQMLHIHFHFRISWCRQNTALAHLKLKAWEKRLQDTGDLTQSDIPILGALRNISPSSGSLTLFMLRPTYLVQGLRYLLSVINEIKLSRHLSAIESTYSFHFNI
jgi:hypothetical protein